jgi:hypothetical protein
MAGTNRQFSETSEDFLRSVEPYSRIDHKCARYVCLPVYSEIVSAQRAETSNTNYPKED